jgi:hypothetical protein
MTFTIIFIFYRPSFAQIQFSSGLALKAAYVGFRQLASLVDSGQSIHNNKYKEI